MTNVLVLAKDSLLADAIEAALSRETELYVVRMPYLEPGKREDYPVVIVVNDAQPEGETSKLADIARGDRNALLINVSLESTNIHVFESYQLINPEMDQILDLLKEFSRKYFKDKPVKRPRSQKKMNKGGYFLPEKIAQEDVNVPVKDMFRRVWATDPNENVSFLFPLRIRRNYSGNVTIISGMCVKN